MTHALLGFPGPGTVRGAQIWLGVLALAYVALRVILQALRGEEAFSVASVLDGVTFAGSAMLLLAVFDADVLYALGEITLYLVCASLVGLGYTIRELGSRH